MIRDEYFVFCDPAKVWNAITDTRRWGVRSDGFTPDVDSTFVFAHYPVLGTRYSGFHRCKVTVSLPDRLLEFSTTMLAVSGPATTWKIRFRIDACLPMTRVLVELDGVDLSIRDQRVMQHVTRLHIGASLLRSVRELARPRPAIRKSGTHGLCARSSCCDA